MKEKKKYFFGWENIKWVIREFAKTWSEEASYFSSKKIERSLLFCSGLYMLLRWYDTHIHDLEYAEAIAVVVTTFGYAGFTMIQTERSKIKKKKLKIEEDESEEFTDG